MLHVECFPVNMIEENTYLLHDEAGNAALIDCGAFTADEQNAIARYISSHALTLRLHLLTHAHFDHIFGAQWVYDTYGVRPACSEVELPLYRDAPAMMRAFLHRDFPLTTPPAAPAFAPGAHIALGSHTLEVIATPGHTPGGVCFYCAAEALLLSGDSLFLHSIGRCDLPGGDEATLVGALRERILTLPEAVHVLPGHGPATTVGGERRGNPYLQ